MNNPKFLAYIAAAALAITTLGCETVKTTNAGAVGVDRKQQMLVPTDTINQGAAQAYEAELKAARDKGVLNTDKAQLARVTTIAKRAVSIASGTTGELSITTTRVADTARRMAARCRSKSPLASLYAPALGPGNPLESHTPSAITS